MRIVWDEPKRHSNIDKHGFDFADFENAFDFERAVAVPTRSSRTGRYRLSLIGEWNGELVVVAIVSPLGTEALSLISIRQATAKERNAHGY